jgi:hypothetical protein
VSKEELSQRAGEVLGETERARLGLEHGPLPPAFWKSRFIHGADVTATVLDSEAVLLNLENGVYYSLNRVGTVVWEFLMNDQPLEAVLASIRDRFDVAEDVAREDVAVLVTHLRGEGLIVERG